MKFTGADVGGDPFEDVIPDQQVIAVLKCDMAEGVAGSVMDDQRILFPRENLIVFERKGSGGEFGDGHGTEAKEFDDGIEFHAGSAPMSQSLGEFVGEFCGSLFGILKHDAVLGVDPDFCST